MPSDVVSPPEVRLIDRVWSVLDARVDAFRAAIASAEDEVHHDLVRGRGEGGLGGELAFQELGPFATGRIDPERFSMLLGASDTGLTPESIDVLGKADAILTGFARGSNHSVSVEARGDLRDAVKDGLAHLGQVFGASRAVELARSGAFDPVEHGYLLGPLPFRLWNRAERGLAPPLVVEVRGEDCLPAGLGEFLDGSVTVVLVASGPTTPAPLSRLITPGTLVIQTADPDDLQRLASAEHPAVALLFDEDRSEQAYFVHDPDEGETTWDRLTVSRMPSDADVGRGRRPPMWLEEVAHLRSLAEPPETPRSVVSAATADATEAPSSELPATDAPDGSEVGSVDRLAAWLLAQTDMGDL